MIKNTSDSNLLPCRSFVLFQLSLNWIVCTLSGLTFLNVQEHFPSWFGPMFLVGILLFLSIISFYFWQVLRMTAPKEPPGKLEIKSIWCLLVSSVLCTSAVHRFFPFRPDVFSSLRKVVPCSSIIKYNFILTAGSLLAILVLGILYRLDYRRAAVIGLIVLAAIMLIPNDDCGNYFNRPWIQWIGGSPLMFMPNAVVILIGCCALYGIRPRLSIAVIGFVNACVLALGLGHLTGVVW